jgi:predicted dinucleotide-utilizing enzyme
VVINHVEQELIVKMQNIAIIGLGRIGSVFLETMLKKKQNINLVCVAEVGDTPGKARAKEAGVTISTLDEIVALGNGVDIIFELTGAPAVRRELRTKMLETNNLHSVIASETVARLIAALVVDTDLPDIAGRKAGY